MHQLSSGVMLGTFGMSKISIGLETYPQSWNMLFLLQLAPVSPARTEHNDSFAKFDSLNSTLFIDVSVITLKVGCTGIVYVICKNRYKICVNNI